MSHYRRNSDVGCLGGIVFWGALILASSHEGYALPIFIVAGSLLILIFCYQYYASHKCKHGVYKGTNLRRGKCKCPRCQEEYIHTMLSQGIYCGPEYEEEYNRIKAQQDAEQRIIDHQRKLQEDYEREMALAENIKRELLLSKASIVDSLNPYQFEDYIAFLLRKLGFKNVTQTPYVNDGGKDIICSYNGRPYYVECKHYNRKNKISRELLQKLFAAMTADQVKHGLFFTTSSFTSEAIRYGKQYNIRTIDGEELAAIIAKNLVNDKTSLEYNLPCPECGEVVKFNYFNGPTEITCSNGHSVKGVSDIQLFPRRVKGTTKKKHLYFLHKRQK